MEEENLIPRQDESQKKGKILSGLRSILNFKILPGKPAEASAPQLDIATAAEVPAQVPTPEERTLDLGNQPETPVPEQKDAGKYQETLEFLRDKLYSVHNLEDENICIKGKYAEVRQKAESLELSLIEAKDQIESGRVAYVKKESELNSLQQRLGRLEWDLNESHKKLAEYEKCQEAYQTAIQSGKDKIVEYEQITAGLENILSAAKKEHSQKTADLKSALDSKDQQVSDYSHQIQAHQKKEEDYLQQLNQSKTSYVELEARLNKVEEMHKQVTSLLRSDKQ